MYVRKRSGVMVRIHAYETFSVLSDDDHVNLLSWHSRDLTPSENHQKRFFFLQEEVRTHRSDRSNVGV